MTDEDPFLTLSEFAALIRTPVPTVRHWRKVGYGPPAVKVGRRVLYRTSAVQSWLREREGSPAA